MASVYDIKVSKDVIYTCHISLLQSLKQRLSSWNNVPSIGDVFLEKVAFMKLYSHYINNYDTSIAKLKHYKGTKATFKKFVEEFDLASDHKEDTRFRLHIEGFLILPVQRIPRYVLLLKYMSQHPPGIHPDFEAIHTALSNMERLVSAINLAKSVKDNKEKMMALQESIVDCPFDLTDSHSRTFIREGPLMQVEIGSRMAADREYHVVLFNDGLLVCRAMKDNQLRFKHWILLTTAHASFPTDKPDRNANISSNSTSNLYAMKPSPNSPRKAFSTAYISETALQLRIFSVQSPSRNFQFYAQKPIDTDYWCKEIKKAIDAQMKELVGTMGEADHNEICRKLVQSLFSLDQEYVDKLEVLQTLYLQPLENVVKGKEAILNVECFNAIFGPFFGEHGTQNVLVQKLKDRLKIWDKCPRVSDIYNPEWLLGFSFHSKSRQALQEALDVARSNPAFTKFEEKQREADVNSENRMKALRLTELIVYPMKHLASCFIIFRQLGEHTQDEDEMKRLQQLIAAVKQILDEDDETQSSQQSSPKAEKLKKMSLKFWKKTPKSSPTSPNTTKPKKSPRFSLNLDNLVNLRYKLGRKVIKVI